MPSIQLCPSCKKKLKTPEDDEGKKLRCPHCKTMLLIGEDGLEVYEEETVGSTAEKPSSRKCAAVDGDDDDRPVKRRRRDDDDEDDRDRDEDDRPRKKKKKRRGGGIPPMVWIGGGVGLGVAAILVVLFVFVLGGNKFSSVKEGMTRQEVKDLLGKPALERMVIGNGTVIWTDPPIESGDILNRNAQQTSKVKSWIVVDFSNDKVTKKQVFNSGDFGSSGFR